MVKGTGVGGIKSADNWCNIFSRDAFGADVDVMNISEESYSNERIFITTLAELNRTSYDYVFVGITGLHRYWFHPGLETYDTTFRIVPHTATLTDIPTITLNDFQWPSKKLRKLANDIILLDHPHHTLKNVCTYINTLLTHGSTIGTNIKFVNTLLPIDQNYFKRLKEFKPNDLTPYTQSLLNVTNRDDDEIYELYNKMHDHYEECGGIRQDHWLNLYDSFYSQKIDLGTDGIHPGIKSHMAFAKNINKAFKKTYSQ